MYCIFRDHLSMTRLNRLCAAHAEEVVLPPCFHLMVLLGELEGQWQLQHQGCPVLAQPVEGAGAVRSFAQTVPAKQDEAKLIAVLKSFRPYDRSFPPINS